MIVTPSRHSPGSLDHRAEVDPAEEARIAEELARAHAADKARRAALELAFVDQNKFVAEYRRDKLIRTNQTARAMADEIRRLSDDNAKLREDLARLLRAAPAAH